MYDMKALYEAHSVEEAVKLRLEHPEAQIIAGGTDVLVQMREGRRAGKELISIQKVDEIRGICMDEQENIRIGSRRFRVHAPRVGSDRRADRRQRQALSAHQGLLHQGRYGRY